jgi:Winged helix-turn helix
MRPIRLDSLTKAQLAELDHLYRTAREGRLRIRALMVLLAAERGMVAAQIAAVVRKHEQTVRLWLVRYQAEGVAGLADAPRSGAHRRSPRPTGPSSWPSCAGARALWGAEWRAARPISAPLSSLRFVRRQPL